MWFTLSHGILNEIYYPRVDSACTRDLGLIVTDGAAYFSEEKRHARSEVSLLAPGVPAFHVCNTAIDGRYQIEKDVLTDPSTDVVLQRIHVSALQGTLDDYRVYVLLAPHLNNHGAGNTAWVGDYKGVPLLFAQRGGHALALACSSPWLVRSVGFAGVSDGWQQLRANGRIVNAYERAERGNVALTGEVDLAVSGSFVLVVGFGNSSAEAGQRAVSSLITGFDAVRDEYVAGWQRWQQTRTAPRVSDVAARPLVEFSAATLRVHESKSLPGGVIASLSIPWGFNKGDADLGGYHLVWPRDLVEIAGGFLALGANDDARRVLRFLRVTQDADGHWCQNMWLDGSPYWNGVQMDEAALPILLVDLAWRAGALSEQERADHWPMVRRAAAFIARNGPVSQQDRWEEDPGYSPFTLAAEIAALLVAAEAADANGESAVGRYLRDTADTWYSRLDEWIYVDDDTALARRCGVDGYYVRVADPDDADAASPKDGFVPIKNRPPSEASARRSLMVSPDALALVRFGLRAADDPRITNTVAGIDALLKAETPNGTAWYRYNGDGYGEHEDGRPFDGTGVGRPWPLLAGERGHYELAAGHVERARALVRAMVAFAGESLLLPEQIWDADDIPERELFKGAATGSARPLVWAHAEYIKLCRSIQDGAVFDRPPQTVARYLGNAPPPRFAVWRFNNKIRRMSSGHILRIETLARAVIHAGLDGWSRIVEIETVDSGLGVWIADLDIPALAVAHHVDFTFYWPEASRWEGVDFSVLTPTLDHVTAAESMRRPL